MHDFNVFPPFFFLCQRQLDQSRLESGRNVSRCFSTAWATFDVRSDLIDLAIRLKNLVLQASTNNRKCLGGQDDNDSYERAVRALFWLPR